MFQKLGRFHDPRSRRLKKRESPVLMGFHMSESRIGSIRNAFISGLLLLLPMAVTWIVFSWLVETVGGGFRPLFLPAGLRDHPNLQFLWDLLVTLIVITLIT